MIKRSLRIKVLAAMFSAITFISFHGTAEAITYTGEGNYSFTDSPETNDGNDLIITDGARVSANALTPKKITNKKYEDQFVGYKYEISNVKTFYGNEGTIEFIEGDKFSSDNVSMTLTDDSIKNLKDELDKIVNKDKNKTTLKIKFREEKSTIHYGKIERKSETWDDFITKDGSINETLEINIVNGELKLLPKSYIFEREKTDEKAGTANHGTMTSSADIKTSEIWNRNVLTSYDSEDASITVSSNGRLLTTDGISTTKNISITDGGKIGNSYEGVTANNLFVDGDVAVSDPDYIEIDTSNNTYLISGSDIKVADTLSSQNNIYASDLGNITAGKIESKNGNIFTANIEELSQSGGIIFSDKPDNLTITGTITAGGKVKGNALNVGVINASSALTSGNQSIKGIFSTNSQAKFNAGIIMNGQKITSLGAATLSDASTEVVNGAQLYATQQKLTGIEGQKYTAGSDIDISSTNEISVSKVGKVASKDNGIMTGDAVYQETSKIDSILKSHNASITSNNSKLENLTTSIESLRKSLGTINSSVSDAISGLPGSLANFANKDLTDLSDTGINTLKSYIKSEIKKQMPSNSKTASYAIDTPISHDTSAVDNVIASKAKVSDLTALEKEVDGKADKAGVSLVEDTTNAKADFGYVNDGLAKKADQAVVEAIGRDVDRNTFAIAKNTELIQANTEAISGLKNSKVDVSGSNIDASSWSKKVGTGTVAKDDTGLVTGNCAASALDKKADIGYVAMGLSAMEGSLEQVNQSVTKDVSRVGAGASALMGLHPTGDKFEFATAYGHYKNSNNTALGVFYKPTANSTLSMAGTIGDGDAMVSAGVSIKLGLNKEVKKVITPNEFAVMKSAVDSQDEKLDQIESALRLLMTK